MSRIHTRMCGVKGQQQGIKVYLRHVISVLIIIVKYAYLVDISVLKSIFKLTHCPRNTRYGYVKHYTLKYFV